MIAARRLVVRRQRQVFPTALIRLMAIICFAHGKLTLTLTRRAFPPCRMASGMLRKKYRPCSDCACRHEILIAPARLKPLIFPLFCRAGVVFLSRRPSNTQHSDAQGRCFFHYQAAAPTHIARNNASGGNRKTACKAGTQNGAGDHSPAPPRMHQR